MCFHQKTQLENASDFSSITLFCVSVWIMMSLIASVHSKIFKSFICLFNGVKLLKKSFPFFVLGH